LKKLPIKGFSLQRDEWGISAKNDLEEKLITVQINSPSADFPPKNGNMVSPAKIQINLLPNVLMIANAHVRSRRRDQYQCFTSQMGESMITELRVLPRDLAQAIQIHGNFHLFGQDRPSNN